MSATRADPELVARIADWVGDGALALADLEYEGEPDIFRITVNNPVDTALTVDQQATTRSTVPPRCLGERANSPFKTTYKALRHYRGCPWSLGDIVAGRAGPAPSREPSNHMINNS